MSSMYKRARKGAAVAGVAAIGASFAFLTPAGAAGGGSTGNSLVIGSGSASTYQVMTQLADLYNSLPGCNLIAASGVTQPLNYSCPAPVTYPNAGYGENPLNEVVVNEPALGSSNGIDQIENQGSGSTTAVPTVDFARSSRAASPPSLGGSDQKGMNFVAFAKDAVSWFHFKEVLGTKTASYSISNLSKIQLEDIWDGTYKYWCQLAVTPCKTTTAADPPLEVYAAQSGSGTLSTWATYLGQSSSNIDSYVSTQFGPSHVILENEDNQIISSSSLTASAKNWLGNAIVFFSYGKFSVQCKTSVCGGGTVPGTSASKPTTPALGSIEGVVPSETTIYNDSFPVPRLLYNVYADSFKNTNLTPANQATLNFASEDGFLCKPQGTAASPIVDPNTGVWLRQEIDNVILANGFFPLPAPPAGKPPVDAVPGKEGSVVNPAKITAAPYKGFDPALPSSGQYSGYCIVSTTDGG